MKTMNDFSAFKLNKNQMGAMKGGAVTYTCTMHWDDGDSFTYQITTDLDIEEVRQQVEEQSLGGTATCV